MQIRDSIPAAAGSRLRQQLRRSQVLREVLSHPAALAARRTTARTARRIAPLSADRLIADLKGTRPLLERVRAERSAAPRPGGRVAALRATAALSAAAVVGGLVVTVPAAAVQPGTPPVSTSRLDTPGTVPIPAVYPRPQDQRAAGHAVAVPRRVTVVAAARADPGALDAVREVLRGAGAAEVSVTGQAPAAAPGNLTVYVGGTAEGADGQTDRALRELAMAAGSMDTAAASPARLPAGGYVLVAGRTGTYGTVVLAGVDAEGTFNAAQTLRQLVTAVPAGQGQIPQSGRGFPGVTVRDWPSTSVRGTVEGFYGQPWTSEQRLSEIDFLGRTKQNSFLYAPGDDPYRLSQWREPYPAAQQAQLRALAGRAARDHVVLGYAIAPGQSFCYSSDEDVDALVAKLKSLWQLGFRSFQLQFADVSYDEWHCGADRGTYGSGPAAAAKAQGELAGKVLKRFVSVHAGQGIAPLSVMPTEYHQQGTTPYRAALAQALPPAVQVAWTGVGVVPAKITADELHGTEAVLAHPLVTMDNYPVNDWSQDRLHLGPYTGRDASVATDSAALMVNAMEQPVASRIALFTAADYAWNPVGYRPQDSWLGALRSLTGTAGTAEDGALRALAGNSSSSALSPEESAYLVPLLQRFWAAAEPTVPTAGNAAAPPGTHPQQLEEAAEALRGAFAVMEHAPESLREVAGGELAEESGPWLAQLSRYGKAGRSAVDMLLAQRGGDGEEAWQARLELRKLMADIGGSPATIGAGVLDPFLDRALKAADTWAGVGADAVQPTTTMGAAHAHELALMTDTDPDSFYWSDAPPQQGDAVGVDLGTARPVGQVTVRMGAAGSDAPAADAYLRDGVLEYSSQDGVWHRLATAKDEHTVTAALPPGATARFVRLRATQAQESAVAVREFSVTGPGEARPTASGPEPAAGSSARAAVDGDPDTAYRSVANASEQQFTVDLGAARPLDRVSVLTDPSVPMRAAVEVRSPDGGWVRLGDLRSGYNEVAASGRTADAIRLTWDGSQPLVLNEVVPWYADAPIAQLDLGSTALDVVAGAAPTVTGATLQATRAGASSGVLAVRLPVAAKGLTVSAPSSLAVPRGGRLAAPLRIAATAETPSGAYDVEVSFTAGGRTVRRMLHVRVVRQTAGADLALGAVATSSGDETADFPAGRISDGDPATRWSSPADDAAWVQLELPQAARLGAAVLHWQDAYASAYRIETSADGVTWSVAASVQNGRGGTETVRFDAPDTRFLRVQGVQRATKYGYSLWSVEAYAVAAPPAAPPKGTPAAPPTGAPAAPPTGAPAGGEAPAEGEPPAGGELPQVPDATETADPPAP